MTATTSALIVTLVGALVSTASFDGPPALPPESAPVEAPPVEAPPSDSPPSDSPPSDSPPTETGGETRDADVPPPPVRSTLPPGLQPVPFPLENQRPVAPPTSDGSTGPAPERRSIVDLRDPFNRPPPRPRAEGERDATVRLLMPDLKDPFAPGVRRVRSKTLDLRVPNDIRDPFRSPPPPDGRPACVKTTADGTVVQAPGKPPPKREECQPSRLDLRDPFDRDPNR